MDNERYILQLKSKITDLEDEIDELTNHSILRKFSEAEGKMLKIISKEMERLEESCNQVSMDKDDTKKFDTLVKDYVALRGKMEKMIDSNDDIDEDELAELISIVQGGKDE